MFCGRGCDNRVSGSQSVRQTILLDVDGSSVPNVLAQWKRGEAEVPQERFRLLVLFSVLRSLKKLHIRLHGQQPLVFAFNQPCGFGVPPLNPNEDVRIKDHGSVPREAAPWSSRLILAMLESRKKHDHAPCGRSPQPQAE